MANQISDTKKSDKSLLQRLFNLMPVAAVIDAKIFCMHGGLSPSLQSLQDIRKTTKPLRNPSKVSFSSSFS